MVSCLCNRESTKGGEEDDPARLPEQIQGDHHCGQDLPPMRPRGRDLLRGHGGGYVIYNDTLSCVQWCKYARQCVGEETYERLMAFVKLREQRKAEEAANAKAG